MIVHENLLVAVCIVSEEIRVMGPTIRSGIALHITVLLHSGTIIHV